MRAADFEVKENPFEVEPSKAKTTALKTNKKGWGAEEKLFWKGSWINISKVLSNFAAEPQPSKLNSHKNLGKPLNLDQIGFDLSDNEISGPDRRFVIDSVLGRGRIWSENNGL